MQPTEPQAHPAAAALDARELPAGIDATPERVMITLDKEHRTTDAVVLLLIVTGAGSFSLVGSIAAFLDSELVASVLCGVLAAVLLGGEALATVDFITKERTAIISVSGVELLERSLIRRKTMCTGEFITALSLQPPVGPQFPATVAAQRSLVAHTKSGPLVINRRLRVDELDQLLEAIARLEGARLLAAAARVVEMPWPTECACGYDLQHLTIARCPECGTEFPEAALRYWVRSQSAPAGGHER